MASELQRLNDPNYAISLAVGPPLPSLVAQQPNRDLVLGGRFESQETRFVFKRAHMSREDFRVFDHGTGQPVAVMHHYGKNPYWDPLGQSAISQAYDKVGDWESVCTVTGYHGMPSLKIRPKAVSRHGRQYVYEAGHRQPLFNIGKESKLKHLALRSNLAIRKGEGKDVVYRVLPDLMGRTLQIQNEREELVCFAQKSAKALIMEATLGSGSEMVIDVAPGVDWTLMIAIIMAVQQVGAHFLKDALGNWVVDPLKDQAVQGALQGTGMSGAAASAGQSMDDAIRFVQKMQNLYQMFYA